jgi:hypothetical protein
LLTFGLLAEGVFGDCVTPPTQRGRSYVCVLRSLPRVLVLFYFVCDSPNHYFSPLIPSND